MSENTASNATASAQAGAVEQDILLDVQHLTKRFAADTNFFGKATSYVQAVDDVSFQIRKGEAFGLVGESGCGKTTVGKMLVNLLKPTSGKIVFDGKELTAMKPAERKQYCKDIQLIFQDPYASLNPRMRIGDIIAEPIITNNILPKDQVEDRVNELLERVGLANYMRNRYPHEFSGGQRQRVGLARAMVMEPEFVVADEPISALDVSIRAQILNLMNKFQAEQGTTYMFIAHDLSIVRYISDRIGVIYKGKIVEIASSEELFDYPLHPYTRSLISAIPLPDPQLEKHKVLYTYDPSMHNYTDETHPELVDIGHGHFVYGSPEEIAEYRALRERGEPLKSLSIVGVNAEAPEEGSEVNLAASEVILDRPVHDTGSAWYAILSFFLPILGLIAAFVFRRHNYIRNYKACRKGVIAFAATLGVCVALLLLFIVIAIL